MSDKVKPQHLARKAVLYIRQSSALQVAQNQESQRLQYAMRERIRQLGWAEIDVIDEDLGRSAAGTAPRSGFERMVAEVCLGQVGAVAAREVSRFARNSRDWQQLVEVCRMVETVLIDQETVYDPRLSNDRLLLGLKGSLNEYELDLLRQRALEARNAKARRGEFLASVPAGYLKTSTDSLEMDPDQRVQGAIRLLFAKCQELGAGRQVWLWFRDQGLELPIRRHGCLGWETVWKRPTYSLVNRILTNPIYAGAYAFGRSESRTSYEGRSPVKKTRRRAREGWLALIPNHHEGYVSWDEFERVQAMLRGNAQRFLAAKPGAVKRGAGLLAGLLRCRRCGRKIMVRYSGPFQCRAVRYACQRATMDYGEPACISFGGIPVDDALAQELLRVVQPAALEASLGAQAEQTRSDDDVVAALEREQEAARYAAERAGKQYDAADPANRLVADELERRWNAALERVRDVARRLEEKRASAMATPPPSAAELRDLAGDLEAVWNHSETDVRVKKRLVRALIHEVVADVDEKAAEVVLMVHWQGGVHTELRVPRRRRGQHAGITASSVVDAVRSLARICRDRTIAAMLNRNGLRTGRGNRWSQERVTSLRANYEIPNYCSERAASEGWMNLKMAAAQLGISPRTLRLAIERGDIEADHPLSDGPWVVNRQALQTDAGLRLAQRVERTKGRVAVPAPGQQTFDFSGT